ncbi:MAG: sulfatase [Chloroflexia bacterium]|nr:sulfatase [Chloroflexia bacterium]
MERPNIVYLHSHDTGRYVQPYGYAVPTRQIQWLAQEGIVFRRVFCAAPTCSPSRAALLTGQAPHSSGMLGLAHRGWALDDYGQHLVHTLRGAGYTSTLAGVQHVAADASVIGYDHVLDVPDRSAATVAPVAAAFIRDAPGQPFFLDIGFFETHREFPEPDLDERDRFCRPPAALPDTPETRRDMAGYLASARALDSGVGIVLDALDEAGLDDTTLVICTTDHGPAFPGMKCSLTDHGIGVSLIIRGPGGLRGGKINDALVSQIDVFPTICDLLGIEHPSWLQGRSLLPLVRGETDVVNDAIFAEVTYHAAYEPQRAVRTDRWKYIRRYGEHPGPVLPNVDGGPSKDLWLHYGWRERPLAHEQLYDLIFDPNEANNLADDPAYAEPLADLRARLDGWMHDTADPLLHGAIGPPPGREIRVNDVDGMSPREPTRVLTTS